MMNLASGLYATVHMILYIELQYHLQAKEVAGGEKARYHCLREHYQTKMV